MAETDLQELADSIVSTTPGLPAAEAVASWKPSLNGDIDIRIASDGSWHHCGSPIQREGLLRLFASILRREDDGDFYLVTPVEKWRIRVDRHPLLAIDCDHQADGDENGHENGHEKGHENSSDGVWYVLLNTGGSCRLGGAVALHVDAAPGDGSEVHGCQRKREGKLKDNPLPWVALPNGLSAQLTRAAWYRLVEAATVDGEHAFITSAGERIGLGRVTS
ncbi:MAG: DUF1285 domain-containing protein [Halieaceae bacterium]|nr:DUF1285 domain-containing protein [Halieaceae bacterium]